jgi:hypothetical protein
LDRIEGQLAELLARLEVQRTVKDWNSIDEAAAALGRAPYTVREWARYGRIRATKRASGRGRSKEWTISADELTRIRNEGLLPMPSMAT